MKLPAPVGWISVMPYTTSCAGIAGNFTAARVAPSVPMRVRCVWTPVPSSETVWTKTFHLAFVTVPTKAAVSVFAATRPSTGSVSSAALGTAV
jgi:hypothetical protein